MKKLYFVLFLFTSFAVFAQPQYMNYQGVARDLSGEVISNKMISLQIHIIVGQAEGTTVYTEIHQISTSKFGVFNIHIGNGIPVYGAFSDVQWSSDNHFVKVKMDIHGGQNFKEMGTTQLLSVPYAFHAQTAGSLTDPQDPFLKSASNKGVPSQSWSLFGNSKTNPDKDQLGTTDEADLILVTNNQEKLRLTYDGDLLTPEGIGMVLGGDFTVANGSNTLLSGNLTVEGSNTLLKGDLDVEGKSTFASLKVSGPGTMDGNHVAVFENTDGGSGDGIKIKLGKKSANNGLENIDIPTGLSTSDIKKVKNMIDAGYDGNKTLLLGEIVAESLIEDAQTIGGLVVGIGNKVIGFINDQLDLPFNIVPRVTVFPGFELGMPCVDLYIGKFCGLPNINISSYSIGPYEFPEIPDLNFSAVGVDKIDITDPAFWGMPDLDLSDNVSNPLNNSNEFIRFADVEDKKMGSIRAVSIVDWSNNYLNPVYLWQLRSAIKSTLDKKHARYHFTGKIMEALRSYSKIGVEYSSGNGDYAEWLRRMNPEEKISAGDIVAVRGGKITKDLNQAEQVMAVSSNPIMLGNEPPENETHLGNSIAFMGQIPVKVMGAVQTGDFIVGKGDIIGYGVAVSPENMTIEDYYYAVGRAWEEDPDEGPKMINTVIGVHNGNFLNILKKYQERFDNTESRLDAMEAKIDLLTGTVSK